MRKASDLVPADHSTAQAAQRHGPRSERIRREPATRGLINLILRCPSQTSARPSTLLLKRRCSAPSVFVDARVARCLWSHATVLNPAWLFYPGLGATCCPGHQVPQRAGSCAPRLPQVTMFGIAARRPSHTGLAGPGSEHTRAAVIMGSRHWRRLPQVTIFVIAARRPLPYRVGWARILPECPESRKTHLTDPRAAIGEEQPGDGDGDMILSWKSEISP